MLRNSVRIVGVVGRPLARGFIQNSKRELFYAAARPAMNASTLQFIQAKNFHSSRPSFSELAPELKDRFEKEIKDNNVVLYMKGVPEAPMCGFSNAVVRVLDLHGLAPGSYHSVNVLEDDEVRQGIKLFSDWQTIPQLYLGGEFIGGADIVIQMHQNGEMVQELANVGIKSPQPADPPQE
eukprot:Clim_evm2s195 gene=Clim_evmTU2s195